jgi:DNA-binding beta-propeller fold protein YncE
MARRSLIRRPRVLLVAAALAIAAAAVAGVEYARSTSGLPAVPYTPKNHAVTAARVLTPTAESPRAASARSTAIRHYEYVFPNGEMVVYDIDHGHRLVQRVELPDAHTIRGVAVDPKTRLLYVSYGGDGDGNGNGSMLKYDLLRDRILWQKDYSTGIDSMAITHDGRRIYMPVGELNPADSWEVIDARDGRVLTRIHAGQGPHNTTIGLSGKYVYLSPRDSPWLVVVSTKTNKIVRKIGPMRSGVRPTTVNGKETLAFTTATRFLGFQVSSIRTGKVLYTVPIQGFTWSPETYENSAPSHGISLSPDEKQLWVMDGPNSHVHVYDVSGLPARAPRHLADIKLSRPVAGDEQPCVYDCNRSGWIQFSRSGRYVYVGDSGDVIDARTRKIVFDLQPLYDSKKTLELDWRRGVPVFTTTRAGLGYRR